MEVYKDGELSESQKIAMIFGQIRKKRKIPIDDVVSYLGSKGIQVATKTVYGWEGGRATPDINTFLALCSFYGISHLCEIEQLKTGNEFDETLEETVSRKELELIKAYRAHRDMQLAVNKLLDI